MQKLILPFNICRYLCGYKNPKYQEAWHYPHYGVDITSKQGGIIGDDKIIASGEGLVIDTGFDNSGGNIIIIQYNDVYNHHTGENYDVIARYLHLSEILVHKGQRVLQGQIIALEGKTRTKDYHLHIEFDTDTKFPRYSPQVSSRDDNLSRASGNILMHGYTAQNDTTVNPSYIFHIGEHQKLYPPLNAQWEKWQNAEDKNIPSLNNNLEREYQKVLNELAQEKQKTTDLITDLMAVISKYKV